MFFDSNGELRLRNSRVGAVNTLLGTWQEGYKYRATYTAIEARGVLAVAHDGYDTVEGNGKVMEARMMHPHFSWEFTPSLTSKHLVCINDVCYSGCDLYFKLERTTSKPEPT